MTICPVCKKNLSRFSQAKRHNHIKACVKDETSVKDGGTSELRRNYEECHRCGALLPSGQGVSEHLSNCIAVKLVSDTTVCSEKSPVRCPLCSKNLSQFGSETHQQQHVNRCAVSQEEEEKLRKLKEEWKNAIDCPMCKTPLLPGPDRIAHIKRCAKNYKVSAFDTLKMVQLQENVAKINRKRGISHTSLPEPGMSTVQPKKRPPDKMIPKNSAEEDMQIAKAISLSVSMSYEKATEHQEILSAKKKRRGIDPEGAEALLRQRLVAYVSPSLPTPEMSSCLKKSELNTTVHSAEQDPKTLPPLKVRNAEDSSILDPVDSSAHRDWVPTEKGVEMGLYSASGEVISGEESEFSREPTPNLFDDSESYCRTTESPNGTAHSSPICLFESYCEQGKSQGFLHLLPKQSETEKDCLDDEKERTECNEKEESGTVVVEAQWEDSNDVETDSPSPPFDSDWMLAPGPTEWNVSESVVETGEVDGGTIDASPNVLEISDGATEGRNAEREIFHLNLFQGEENAPLLDPECRMVGEESGKDPSATPNLGPGCRVIKRTNITPMPDYSSMHTPGIKNELNKYGLKPNLAKKKKKTAALLTKIYEATHPIVSGDCEDDDQDGEFADDDDEVMEESLMDLELVEGSSQEEVVENFQDGARDVIRSLPELHRKILLCEPVAFEDVQERLRGRMKCSTMQLVDFLDAENVTWFFKTKRPRVRKGRRKKK